MQDAPASDPEVRPDLSQGAAWMDGRLLPMAEARLPVNDWGVTRSDAVYDVAPVWDGAFVGLDRYLDRFLASLEWARMEIPVDRDGCAASCTRWSPPPACGPATWRWSARGACR